MQYLPEEERHAEELFQAIVKQKRWKKLNERLKIIIFCLAILLLISELYNY